MNEKCTIEYYADRSRNPIGWCARTFNYVRGCYKISEGCAHCYAIEAGASHVAQCEARKQPQESPYKRLVIIHGEQSNWSGIVEPSGVKVWTQPFRTLQRWLAFVDSMSDVFNERLTDNQILFLLRVLWRARWHVWQLLTKRAERLSSVMSRLILADGDLQLAPAAVPLEKRFEFHNVWFGISIENQKRADERLPHLMEVRSGVRFVSAEPLLEHVSLGQYKSRIDWCIVGGESGESYRPMDDDWARALRDECVGADVAFFFKQRSGPNPQWLSKELDGRLWHELPKRLLLPVPSRRERQMMEAWVVREYPKAFPQDSNPPTPPEPQSPKAPNRQPVEQHVAGLTGKLRRADEALNFAEHVIQAQKAGTVGPEVLERLRMRAGRISRSLELQRPADDRHQAADERPTTERPNVCGAVHLELRSANRKLSQIEKTTGSRRPHAKARRPYVATTMASLQGTCPPSCLFKGIPGVPGGCFGDSGFERRMTRRLDAVGLYYTADEIIAEEARQLDAAFNGGQIPQDGAKGGRDLRLHVVGDARTLQGVQMLAETARRWRRRGGGAAWTYTHAWRDIPRDAWGEAISILASVERPEDIEAARARGYAAAIVVEEFPDGRKAFRLPGSNSKIVPCPAETSGATCNQCRLCLDRDLLSSRTTIGFALHGQYKNVAREKLAQLKVNGNLLEVSKP